MVPFTVISEKFPCQVKFINSAKIRVKDLAINLSNKL
jgi:hypothetical protein